MTIVNRQLSRWTFGYWDGTGSARFATEAVAWEWRSVRETPLALN